MSNSSGNTCPKCGAPITEEAPQGLCLKCVLEVEAGDFATNPSDPVNTPDGKLYFTIEDGDHRIKLT